MSPPDARAPQINCGLIGVGTVGSAVLDFFVSSPLRFQLSAPRGGSPSSVPVHIWSASRRTRERPGAAPETRVQQVLRQAGSDGSHFYFDVDTKDIGSRFTPGSPSWRRVVDDPKVDIVIEVTGSPVAESIIEEALWNGKCVVTANKRVMSRSGYELIKLAESRGAVLAYEASVGGGMPIVQTIGASIGSKITGLLAIVNGTTNFILSEMRKRARDPAAQGAKVYQDALAIAIKQGLAEADPSEDVLGEDSRSKLIILAGLAFGVRLRPADVYLRGMARRGRLTFESIFSAADLAVIEGLGYVPRLLAGAQRVTEEGAERIVAWVQPSVVAAAHPMAGVEGSENGCLLQAESPIFSNGASAKSFQIMLRGPGAGGPETASSVIADIQFCARQLAVASRVRSQGNSGQPVPVYMYGAAAFGRSQDYRGAPSLVLSDLVAPYLLRFICDPAAKHDVMRRAITAALNQGGVDADDVEADKAPAGWIYLRTFPVAIGRLESALERVLASQGPAGVSMDILYVPIIDAVQLAPAGRPFVK